MLSCTSSIDHVPITDERLPVDDSVAVPQVAFVEEGDMESGLTPDGG